MLLVIFIYFFLYINITWNQINFLKYFCVGSINNLIAHSYMQFMLRCNSRSGINVTDITSPQGRSILDDLFAWHQSSMRLLAAAHGTCIDSVIIMSLHNARDFAATGDRGGGRQRVRKRRSDPDATVESWVGSRSFQLQSLVEWEFDARRAQPQPSWHGWQERYRQGYYQQRARCRKVGVINSRISRSC